MTGPTPADQSRVLDLVAEFSATDELDRFVDVVLGGLLELIPSIDASWNEMNALAQRVHFRIEPPPTAEFLAEVTPLFERLMYQNPNVRHCFETGDTAAVMWSDLQPLEEIQRTELYAALFEPLGIASQMAMQLPAPAGVVVGFALNRGSEGFDERDRAVFNTLRPHLTNAYRSVLIRSTAGAMRSALNADGWAVVLVDQHGEISGTSEGAVDSASRIGLDISQRLPDTLMKAFHDRVDDWDPIEFATPSAAVHVPTSDGDVSAWVVPSPVLPHVVVLRGERRPQRDGLAAVGLTARQVDVALELASGGTNAQIARRLTLAEGTVKKHLESIYAALGVDNRGAAISRIRQLS